MAWTGIVRVVVNDVVEGADGATSVQPARVLETFTVVGDSMHDLKDKARTRARRTLGALPFTVSFGKRDDRKSRQEINVTARRARRG